MEIKYKTVTLILSIATILFVCIAWVQVGIRCPVRYLHYFAVSPFFLILMFALAFKAQERARLLDTFASIMIVIFLMALFVLTSELPQLYTGIILVLIGIAIALWPLIIIMHRPLSALILKYRK